MTQIPLAQGKTTRKRIEQFRDRWTSLAMSPGLMNLSDKLSPQELKELPVFSEYKEDFLEQISQDVAVATWKKGTVLFEEGSYIDLAFYILSGEVEITLEQTMDNQNIAATGPIFNESLRFQRPSATELEQARQENKGTMQLSIQTEASRTIAASNHKISMLTTMDFNLKKGAMARLGSGEVFGEIGALSGWPQSVTARVGSDCKVVQIRVPVLRRLRQKSKEFKKKVDKLYRERELLTQLRTTPLFAQCSKPFLKLLASEIELVSCNPEEVIASHGGPVDALYMVRSGFVKLTQPYGESEMVVSYLSKGMTFGETELLVAEHANWLSAAYSVEYAELVKIPRPVYNQAVRQYPLVEEQLWRNAATRIKEAGYSKRNIAHASFTAVALEHGLVQGSSMLVIDLNTCTRCDDCVRACAATHGGRARFVREGDKFDNLLVARSCYHCRDPVCLVGCPTGAIGRAGVGDVISITDEICIGCGTCFRNCPYDAIVMHDTSETWPDDMLPSALRGRDRRVASKCDQCTSAGHDPACVSNCPQGCASRVGSLEEFYIRFQRESDD